MDITEKYKSRQAVIGILGLGYVGLPLMLRYTEEKYKVIGVDIDPEKVNTLNKGASYIEHIHGNSIKAARDTGFEATTDFARIAEVDAVIICVPTPLNKYREPDLTFVTKTMESALPHLKSGQVVSLESTTWPGTTDEVLKPMIEGAGHTVGQDIFLVYSPEREDPGRKDFTTKTIPKVCGGVTPRCLEVGVALYSGIIDQVVPVSSTRTAEMVKLLENIHRAVNIGLANEMKVVAQKMKIDIHEVINAAASKPFGFVPYYPGPGLGGHCMPIDPFYLTWKAREYGLHTRFIELAGEINGEMPAYVVNRIADALNDRRKTINGSKILILGVAYKKNVDDMRESPSLEIMALLEKKGAEISYSDPHVAKMPKLRKFEYHLESVEITEERLQLFDCVVLATDHDGFDYELIAKNSRLVIDSRGRFQSRLDNVVRA